MIISLVKSWSFFYEQTGDVVLPIWQGGRLHATTTCQWLPCCCGYLMLSYVMKCGFLGFIQFPSLIEDSLTLKKNGSVVSN